MCDSFNHAASTMERILFYQDNFTHCALCFFLIKSAVSWLWCVTGRSPVIWEDPWHCSGNNLHTAIGQGCPCTCYFLSIRILSLSILRHRNAWKPHISVFITKTVKYAGMVCRSVFKRAVVTRTSVSTSTSLWPHERHHLSSSSSIHAALRKTKNRAWVIQVWLRDLAIIMIMFNYNNDLLPQNVKLQWMLSESLVLRAFTGRFVISWVH